MSREKSDTQRPAQERTAKYPGIRMAADGNTAVVLCEREASDAAGAYPITPSTQMGEMWAAETANGHVNISDEPLIFIEPEGEHAAAAVTAGLSMSGLRAVNFSSGQGVAYMHESLYAAVGKRLTYILNVGARAITKQSLNVHCGHDDYHAVDDTGFFQLFAKNVQEAADLNLIAHRIAELALNPGIVAQDGFLTTHVIESYQQPERELIAEFLGRPDDIIATPTPAQRTVFGETRRRIPRLWDVDNPVMSGITQNQESYAQGVAAQRPFFFDHVQPFADQAMAEFGALTGRHYARIGTYRLEDADYVLVGQGSVVPSAEAVADYLRQTRGIKVGVVSMTMFRPFPGDLLGHALRGRKGVAVMERLDQPLAEDPPLLREIRTALHKCLENGRQREGEAPYPGHAAYRRLADLPPLYAACYGLGSRDLQPEGIIGTVENMLADAPRKRRFYLSVDFLRGNPRGESQQAAQETLLAGYPHLQELTVRGSENPNLMPPGSITVRMHSVGGWGAITTGKNLALTLFDLLGFHVKANPKYGSEKKGQPTTYYMAVGAEPTRVNCEFHYVDVVLSPDPNVFKHSNPLSGLKDGGTFIIQSDVENPEALWAAIPTRYRQWIRDHGIRVYYLDAFRIAREEASDPELEFRMQGIAFQGAFFAASPLLEGGELGKEQLFEAIESQLQAKFGAKGGRVVQDNLRVVQRGFEELRELPAMPAEQPAAATVEAGPLPQLPALLQLEPHSSVPMTDLHGYWERTGQYYGAGEGQDIPADPVVGMGVIPAATCAFRDMTNIRFEFPLFHPERCTGCGNCWTVCPDSAIPGLVSEPEAVLQTAARRLRRRRRDLQHLPDAAPELAERWRRRIAEDGGSASPQTHLERAVAEAVQESPLPQPQRQALRAELDALREEVGDFPLSVTKPFHAAIERKSPGAGGLLSITVNPYTCKGCMECVEVCHDEALVPRTQTPEAVERMQRHWDFWEALPSTPARYVRIQSLEEGIGALETLLLDKRAYLSMTGGDGACLGCGEKTAVHLFTAAVTALMQPRVEQHLAHVDELIAGLERHIQSRLTDGLEVDELGRVLGDLGGNGNRKGLTLSALASQLGGAARPIDAAWLQRVSRTRARLKELKWRYTEGDTGKGRVDMGILNAVGCSSIWGSTYPYNPYPFPWANHLFQDTPSVAMGVFEGHMRKMAEDFKAVRMAELELEGAYDPERHDPFFTHFNWRHFSEEEFRLCPPVVVIGGDGAMNDIGFQNLSRMLMSGKPVKVICLDTQVYSNTGGQACTSGYTGQISDMAEFGKIGQGKEEQRKELGLIGIAHRTAYVMQGNPALSGHLLEGFIEGLLSPRPALFNVLTGCPPEHGIADDMVIRQSKLATEARAYPVFRYDPDRGATLHECLHLEGNPDPDADWPSYTLAYTDDDGRRAEMELPLTFADFAATEARFRKHFKRVPREQWGEDMVPLHEFLELSTDERAARRPFIWVTDREGRLGRAEVSPTMVESCAERRGFWHLLRGLVRLDLEPADQATLMNRLRAEVVGQVADSLLRLTEEENAQASA